MSYPCPGPGAHGRGCDLKAGEWGVCRACAAALARNLAALPALAVQVEYTLARQGACGPRSGPRASTPPLAYDPRASAALGALRAVLVGWVRVLVEERPAEDWPADELGACATWLGERIALLRVHPAAAEIASEISATTIRCWQVIDRAPDLWFAGPCTECDQMIYTRPDVVLIRCTCGAGYEMAGRRAFLLSAARDYRLTIPELGRALLIPHATLRSWRHRGQLLPHGQAEGRDTFLIGDVLDLLGD